MKHKRPIKPTCYPLVAFLLTAAVLLWGCSDQTPVAPGTDESHPLVWKIPFMVGSGLFHGDAALEDGISTCALCHGGDFEGEDSIPGCLECHFDPQGGRSPLGAAWIHGLVGHQNFETTQTICNTCHDIERRFDTGPDICHDCHEDDDETKE